MLRNLTFTYRLNLLVAMFVLGLAMHATFSIGMFEKYRVGGQLDDQFTAVERLRVDIQPPVTYIVESYLLCLAIDVAAERDRPPLIERLRGYQQEYLFRRAYWQTVPLAPHIKAELRGDVDTQAVLFYKTAFEELLPALASHNNAARRTVLHRMDGQFARHQQAINAVVAATRRETEAMQARAIEELHRVRVALYGTLLGFLVVLIAFAGHIRRSIVLPLAKAVALARRVAAGDLTEKIVHQHNDETGQLLHALNDMSESLRARLSERHRSSEERRRALALLERLIETANVIVVALDRTGAITIFNAMAEAVSGYARADVIGKTWSEITVMVDLEVWQREPGAAAAHTVPNSTRQQLRCKSGALRTIEWKNSVLHPSTTFSIAVISFGNDITEQVLMEQALVDAKLAAENANRSKSEFLANMSHEIRTPINAVLGMTALAMRTELSDKQLNYLKKSQSAAKGLTGIIDDILDYSKIEAGKLHFESRRFSIADVLTYVSALLGYKAQEKGLAFELLVDDDVPPFLVGDEHRLRQVLLNLLGNAIKFTMDGRVSLRISLDFVAQHSTQLRFIVDDTGIGIDEGQLATLFDAFEQADSSTNRRHGGTGLGLTISRSLVNMMHGAIWAERRSHRGTRFVFTAQFGEAPGLRSEAVPARDLRALRALVVAEGMALDQLTAALNSVSIDVTPVATCVACLDRLEAAKQHGEAFQFLVLDWDMSALDGQAIVCKIKSTPNIAETSIIVLANRQTGTVLSASSLSAHIDGVLQQPVDAERMLNVLSGAIDYRQPNNSEESSPLDYDAIVAAISGARILLVEDNDINQEIALEVLSSAGLIVELAHNGEEAIAMVGSNDYDAVIMDWQMPVMNGLEATRHIRSDPRFRHLPIIATTANAMTGDRETCIAAGMDDHIAKPLDIDELLVTLMRWIPVRTGMQSQVVNTFGQ
jgi:PAS domain S-box-containing protein